MTELLRKKGFKVTPQRFGHLYALCITKSYPNAEMIFNKLQPYYPTMSLATIYKTVDILNEIGLINILNVGEDAFRYDANHDFPRAYLLHTVRPYRRYNGQFRQMYCRRLKRRLLMTITKHQFYFYGVCAECKAKKVKAS